MAKDWKLPKVERKWNNMYLEESHINSNTENTTICYLQELGFMIIEGIWEKKASLSRSFCHFDFWKYVHIFNILIINR